MTLACRFCGEPLTHIFCDLGMAPPSNSFVKAEHLQQAETIYPLRAYVCATCMLVQLPEHKPAKEIFSHEYAYFSSYSESWLEYCRRYTNYAIDRFGLSPASKVIEIASNDGYLLQFFRSKGIPVLGIEPSANVAKAAEAKGIRTLVSFFGTQTARGLAAAGELADLLVGNNVLAHVPDLNDFVAGIKIVLKPSSVFTMEVPHLLKLIQETQFDTIYHEHFSYFSLLTMQKVFTRHGLTLFDVEELPTHGGSLRIFGRHVEDASKTISDQVHKVVSMECAAGLDSMPTYERFAEQTREAKRALLDFLIAAKRAGKRIVGYGAAAKGNTLLNYCGIRSDFIDFVVDRSPYKQGLHLPGTRIPVYHPERIAEARPDYVLILPWNLKDEIVAQMEYIRSWGGKFVLPIPKVEVLP